MKRHRTLLALALVAVLGADAVAQDAEEGLPPGNFGMSIGVRQGTGRLSDDFGVGMVMAMEAGYHPTSPDRSVSFGLEWSVAWSWFGSDQASISGSLRLLEFNFGARLRRLINEPLPRFLVLGSGVSLLRTNVPIPPDDERFYLGPYVAAGVEQYLFEKLLLSFEIRYGMLVGGPGSICLALGVGFGS
jgi:hypothetical protein